jgi:hypothetical protein
VAAEGTAQAEYRAFKEAHCRGKCIWVVFVRFDNNKSNLYKKKIAVTNISKSKLLLNNIIQNSVPALKIISFNLVYQFK